MTGPTTIRAATPADAPEVASIGRRALPSQYDGLVDPAAVTAAIEQSYSGPALAGCIRRCTGEASAAFLVAERDGRIEGFLHFDSFGPEPELHRLYVSAKARGGGVGARLMEALHDRPAGQREYMLLVVAGNERAVRFYKRYGLTVAGKVDGLAYYRERMGVRFPPGTRPFSLVLMRRLAPT